MVNLKNKEVLVIGGAGFIGSHIVEDLINLSAKVSVVDIKIEKNSYFKKTGLQKKINLELIDIRNRDKITNYLHKSNFEYIFHLAAEPIVENAYNSPLDAFDTNITGTVNILDAVRKMKKIKGILVTSSDKAYGKTDKAYKEEDPLRGDHPYDVSKSCQDLISNSYHVTYGIPMIITRFGNVYGEGDMHFSRIIPGICESLIKNKQLKIRSNGKYIRDYVYVKDVSRGSIMLMEKIDKVNGQAFNLSSKDNLSVIDLIQKIDKVTDQKIKFKIIDSAKNEIPYQHLNDSKIRKLGWKNEESVQSSFLKVFNWYKSNID